MKVFDKTVVAMIKTANKIQASVAAKRMQRAERKAQESQERTPKMEAQRTKKLVVTACVAMCLMGGLGYALAPTSPSAETKAPSDVAESTSITEAAYAATEETTEPETTTEQTTVREVAAEPEAVTVVKTVYKKAPTAEVTSSVATRKTKKSTTRKAVKKVTTTAKTITVKVGKKEEKTTAPKMVHVEGYCVCDANYNFIGLYQTSEEAMAASPSDGRIFYMSNVEYNANTTTLAQAMQHELVLYK
mgnify:FL=1